MVASRVLYAVGHVLSYVNSRVAADVYQAVMAKSVELDTKGKLWRFVEDEKL